MKKIKLILIFSVLNALTALSHDSLPKSNPYVVNILNNGVPFEFIEKLFIHIDKESHAVNFSNVENDSRLNKFNSSMLGDFGENTELFYLKTIEASRGNIFSTQGYRCFYKSGLNNGLMLQHCRKQLKNEDWSGGNKTSRYSSYFFKILTTLGSENDIELINEAIAQMDLLDRKQALKYIKPKSNQKIINPSDIRHNEPSILSKPLVVNQSDKIDFEVNDKREVKPSLILTLLISIGCSIPIIAFIYFRKNKK